MASEGKKKTLSNKTKWIIGGVGGFLVLLIALVVVFGSPSAESVFKDMNETMLKTKSVTINESYKGSGASGESISLTANMYLNLASSSELRAKGDFVLKMTSSGTPMAVDAQFVTVGDSNYVKFSKISSSSSALSASFSQMESKLKGEWIKSRSGDNFGSFAKFPVESIANVLPTPFANLTNDQRKAVLTILQDKSTYTIEESSKVDVSGTAAYKYQIKYNKDQYDKAAKAIAGYVSYFKTSSNDSSEIKSLTVWVNISTKQIIKMEFTGTSSQGDTEGTITFSGYNQATPVEKPGDYSIESELLD